MSRVKVIHQENKGVSSARNLGVSISKGHYICFVDSDDYIDSNLLEDLNNVIKDKKREKILLDDWLSYACNKCFKKSFIKNMNSLKDRHMKIYF